MATLEKIRSKSVFLIIVIGLALLAFIVGDALTNSRNIFGDHTTVAKIGSTSIDYIEYQREREELNNRYEEARRQNPDQMTNFDTQTLGQMALDQLIQKTLVSNAASEAGLRCTPNLLRSYMLENMQNPYTAPIVQQLQASGIAAQTPAQAYDIIFNPKRNGLTDAQVEPLQRAWLNAEKQTEKDIVSQSYTRLLAGTVKANNLDMQALYNDYVATSNVDYAFMPFGQLNEKEYPVTESEIKEAYDKDKKMFAVELPTKEISVIAVTVMPSDADYAASSKLAATTAAYMNANRGPLSKELKKEGVSLSHHTLRAADIPADMRNVTTLGTDTAKIAYANQQGFSVVRLNSVSTHVDSIQLNLVSTATVDLGNRVLAALNAGLPADSVMSKFSMDSVATQLNQWIPLYTADGPTNALPAETLDSLRNAGRYIAINQGAQGMAIAKIVKENAPVTVYDFEEASYVLGPSNATMSAERNKLEKFLAANNTAAKFKAGATKAGYSAMEYAVTANDPAIPRYPGAQMYYPDSRSVMRWVIIDAKEGDVSHIYESKNPTSPILYAVAVSSAYDDFVPASNTSVKEYLTQRIRAEKAGDKLMAKYSKNTQSLQNAAHAMGVQVQNAPQFRFGRNMGIGDPGVTGQIAGTPANKKVNITKGMDGIYVYQVMSQAKENFPFNEQMYQQQYFQAINPDLIGMLKGTSKLKNNIYKFEAGD